MQRVGAAAAPPPVVNSHVSTTTTYYSKIKHADEKMEMWGIFVFMLIKVTNAITIAIAIAMPLACFHWNEHLASYS